MTYEELKRAKAERATVKIKSTGAIGKINGIGLKFSYIDFTSSPPVMQRHLLLFPNEEFVRVEETGERENELTITLER